MSGTPERVHVHYTNDAAGRVFHEHSYSDNHPTHYTQAHPEARREIVAVYLASPEAVEELTRALWQHMADFATEPESYGDPAKVAVNILAALRDQRGAS